MLNDTKSLGAYLSTHAGFVVALCVQLPLVYIDGYQKNLHITKHRHVVWEAFNWVSSFNSCQSVLVGEEQ